MLVFQTFGLRHNRKFRSVEIGSTVRVFFVLFAKEKTEERMTDLRLINYCTTE